MRTIISPVERRTDLQEKGKHRQIKTKAPTPNSNGSQKDVAALPPSQLVYGPRPNPSWRKIHAGTEKWSEDQRLTHPPIHISFKLSASSEKNYHEKKLVPGSEKSRPDYEHPLVSTKRWSDLTVGLSVTPRICSYRYLMPSAGHEIVSAENRGRREIRISSCLVRRSTWHIT